MDFDWKINGNQYQATREGYNLIDIQNNNRIFMNLASDMKHENYENGILFNYDYDSDYAYHNAYRFAFIYYPFKKNKQYRLSWKTQNLGEIPQSLQYYFPEFEQYLTLNNAFTPQNDTNWIAIFVKADDFVEGCKVAITDVMLTEGSEIKPYEQYGASPSPDYPSEIETVGSNINYFDENTVESKFLNSKTGQTSDNASWRCTDFIEILSKQYNFSWKSESVYFQVTVCYYDKNKTFISGNEYGLYGIYSKTFEIPDGANYMKVAYSINVTGKPVTRDKIKLEIGNKRTLYSPYMCGSVEIDVVNKNLVETVEREFPKEYSSNYGVAYELLKKPKMLKANKIYAISLKCKSNKGKMFNKVILKDGNVDNYTWTIYKTIPTTYTIYSTVFKPANDIIVTQLGLQTVEIDTFYFADFLIEEIKEGSTSSDYIEHQSQTAIMPIQQEMLTGDYISSVEHHEWKKIVLDGVNYGCFYMFPNGRFVISNPTTGENIARDCKKIEDWAVAEPQNICCTHLPTVSVADQQQRNMLGITNGTTGEIVIKLDNATEETNTWTAETINAYLKQQYEAGTPVTIYYKLATSLDLELTEEQKSIRDTKLYTYKNITNIAVSDKLASIDVTYKKDLETMFNNIIKQIPSSTSDTTET